MNFAGFVNGSYRTQGAHIDIERTVNWYVDILQSQGAKGQSALYPTQGFKSFARLSQSPGRGIIGTPTGKLYAVSGSVIFEVFSTGLATALDAILGDDLPPTMHFNGVGPNQLFIVSGGRGDLLNLDTNVLTTGVVTNVSQGGFLSNRFLGLDSITHELRLSAANDGLTWPSTLVAGRSAFADPWIAFLVANGEILLLGSENGEWWYDAGLSPYPFVPRLGAAFPMGIVAPRTLIEMQGLGQSLKVWLGRNVAGHAVPFVCRAYTPEPIGDAAMVRQLQRYSAVDDAYSMTFQEEGHQFVLMTFPGAGATWVLDGQTLLWHERSYLNPLTGEEEAWRPAGITFAFGKHLAMDRSSGQIFQMSNKFGVDMDGAPIQRVRVAPFIHNDMRTVFHQRFELDAEVGIGPDDPVSRIPYLILRQPEELSYNYFPCDESIGTAITDFGWPGRTLPGQTMSSIGVAPQRRVDLCPGLQGVRLFFGSIYTGSLSGSSTSFTIEGIFVPEVEGQPTTLMAVIQNSPYGLYFRSNTRQFSVFQGAVVAETVGTKVCADGVPVHFRWTCSAGVWQLYLDGVLDASGTGAISWIPERIGGTGNELVGVFGQFMYYPGVALGTYELAERAAAARGLTEERPEWQLSWSDDQGKNFSDAVVMDNGLQGETEAVPYADCLGSARKSRAYKLVTTMMSPPRVGGAQVDVEPGTM